MRWKSLGRRRRSPRARWPWAAPAWAALVLTALAAPLSGGSAQTVLLQIRPRVGDTLRMRLDQRTEMTGSAHVGGVDSTATMSTELRVLTHAVPVGADAGGTIMQAMTDSVTVLTNGEVDDAASNQARRAVQGRSVRLRVGVDGAVDVLDDPGRLAAQVRDLFAQMPALLPREPVSVGASWSRVIAVPLSAAGVRDVGTLRATFRFDSLSRSGDLAYLTMAGSLARAPSGAEPRWGGRLSGLTGTVAGTVVVDRRRGWMTHTRDTITVRSIVTLPGAAGSAVAVRMTITQWLRAVR